MGHFRPSENSRLSFLWLFPFLTEEPFSNLLKNFTLYRPIHLPVKWSRSYVLLPLLPSQGSPAWTPPLSRELQSSRDCPLPFLPTAKWKMSFQEHHLAMVLFWGLPYPWYSIKTTDTSEHLRIKNHIPSQGCSLFPKMTPLDNKFQCMFTCV